MRPGYGIRWRRLAHPLAACNSKSLKIVTCWLSRRSFRRSTSTAPVQADTPADLGANLANWDAQDETAQTESLVKADGLDLFRFPGGIPADQTHFNVADGQTVPQFAQFVEAVGGAGLITVDYGSGSPQEAAAELAYLQGSPTDNTVIGVGPQWNGTAWVNVNWGTVGQWAALRARLRWRRTTA